MMDKQYRQLRASTSNIDETQTTREPRNLMFLPNFGMLRHHQVF